jgi:hypothetical protein
LTATADVTAAIQDFTPSGFTTMFEDSLVEIFVYKKFGATNADAVQHIENVLEELDVVDRPCQLIVSEVAGAVVIGLSTRATRLSVFKHTHSWIKQSSNLGFRSFIDRMRRDFHNGTAFNLFRTENSKLDPNNGFNFGSWSYESSGHLLFPYWISKTKTLASILRGSFLGCLL